MLTKRPVVFLDRDGVINANVPDYVRHWHQVRIIPGALAALARLADSPYMVVIVTNQAGVGHGLIAPETADEINRRLLAEIHAHGGRIDHIEMCPEIDPAAPCRKPNPGMLLAAVERLNLDLTRAWMVGDAISDLQAGLAVGARPVFVLSGRGQPADLLNDPRLHTCPAVPDLSAAVDLILTQPH